MAKILKHGREESLRREDDAKVQQIVSDIIRDIEERGDAAVKEYTAKFDKFEADSLRLTREQIDACYEELTKKTWTILHSLRSKCAILLRSSAPVCWMWKKKPCRA